MLNNWMRRRDQDTGDSSISVISDCGVARKSSEKLETHHMTILKTVRRISQTTTRSWRMTIQKREKNCSTKALCNEAAYSWASMWWCDEDCHGNHTQIVWNSWRCGWNHWLLQVNQKLAENQANVCVGLHAELHKADIAACLGQRQHINLEELVCRAACTFGKLC